MNLIKEISVEIPIACTLNKADLSQRQNELGTLRQAVCEVTPNARWICPPVRQFATKQ